MLYSGHYDQEVLPGEVQMFLGLYQQGLNFANLPLLGSCTCPTLVARVKYVAHRASCYLYRGVDISEKKFYVVQTVIVK